MSNTNVFKPENKYKITLNDNPTTGFTWVYKCEYPETTHEIERKSVSPNTQTNTQKFGAPSILEITFQSSKSDIIKFYHVRTWLNPKLDELQPDFEYVVIIQK